MKKFFTGLMALLTFLLFSISSFASTLPDWYPQGDVSDFEDFHNSSAARVVDDAGIFSAEEEASLTESIEALIKKSGFDFVIYTSNDSYGFSHQTLAADFYQFNGYGLGDDYSGSVLMICMESGNRGWYTAARGSARSYYDYDNINILDDSIEGDMIDGEYFLAMKTYISLIGQLYSTGRLPSIDLTHRLIIAGVVAVIVGLIVVFVLSSGMKKVKIAVNADSYFVPGSMKLRRSTDHFLHSHVTRIRRDQGRGNGGGGHGGSSHSGGFSSSGGASFSGGGRHF